MSRKKLTPEDLKIWNDFLRGIKPASTETPVALPEKKGLQKISKPQLAPSPKPMERKDFRSIRIQATLDLHGLSLAEGRDAFEAFIKQSANRGYKYLLVITGKGAIHSDQTLRRSLPQWLQDSPFCELVISYANPAKPADGGAGAFYIVLRKKKHS